MKPTKQQRINDLAWDLYEMITSKKGGEEHEDLEEALKFTIQKNGYNPICDTFKSIYEKIIAVLHTNTGILITCILRFIEFL